MDKVLEIFIKFIENLDFSMILLTLLKSLLMILFIHFTHIFMMRAIKKLLRLKLSDEPDRVNTYYFVIRDLTRYVLYVVYLVVILSNLGVNLTLLITSIGAISVVIGIAGKELILDVINGFFIIFEGYYHVGDYVKVENYEGYVSDFRIKSTFLKTFNNEIIVIPNSQMVKITNCSKLNAFTYANVPINYDVSVKEIETVIVPLLYDQMKTDHRIDLIEYLGIDLFNHSSIELRFKIECDPEDRFFVKRYLNRCAKMIYDEHGYEIPFSQLVIHSKKDIN